MRLSARVTKRLITLTLFLALIGTIFLTPLQALAQSADSSSDYKAPNTTADVPKNLHTYTQNVMIEIMAAISCQVTGIDPTNPHAKCLGSDPKTGEIGFVESGGGAIGATSGMISMLMTPPVNVGEYAHYLAGNFGVAKKSYAANSSPSRDDCNATGNNNQTSLGFPGTGFCALSPLLTLWSAFRNIVYLFFTILFLFIGLAIMLRIKIDPRTVMTIQNSIPKVIIGLILITFSYAIAAFMVDLMYTTTYAAGNIIAAADPKQEQNVTLQVVQASNPIAAADHVGNENAGVPMWASGPAGAISSSLSPFFDNNYGRIITGAIGAYIGKSIGSQFSSTFGGIIGGLIGGILGGIFGPLVIHYILSLILFLILTIALIWALLRVWFVLLTSYIFILFDVVLGPFWILAGIMPGGKAGIGGWLRDLLSHLAVFPAVTIMFLMGRVFVDAFSTAHGAFVAPMIGAFNYQTLGAVIGIGIVLSTPEVLNLTRALFKAPKMSMGGGFGKAIGVGSGVLGAGAKAGWGQLYKPATYNRSAGVVRRKLLQLSEKAAGWDPEKTATPNNRWRSWIASASHNVLGTKGPMQYPDGHH